MADIIRIQNVTKTYPGGVLAVDELSLSVEEGEFVTFLGPSGCGKTTTLRMIAGFEMPDSGRILLAGADVTDLPPYRRQVNTVFQDYALFPHMTIRDNVGYGLRVAGIPRGEIKTRVDEALETVELSDKAGVRPAVLSGGQKQRAALARALVRRPKVLLLDEPLAALDAKLREAMQVELKHLHRRLGITFVFVTHAQTEALIMSDRVVVMDRGRMVQAGSPTELYDRPATPYVADFIGTSNMIEGRVADAAGEMLLVDFAGGKIRCRNGQKFNPGDRVVTAIRPEKVRLQDAASGDDRTILSGTVIDSLFRGDSYRLEVDIRQPQPFLVDIQLNGGAEGTVIPANGAAVELAIDPATISVFPLGGESR